MAIFRRSKTDEPTAIIDLNAPPSAETPAPVPSPPSIVAPPPKPDPALGLAVQKLREGHPPRYSEPNAAVYPTEQVEFTAPEGQPTSR